jgi:hypothetical protein
MDHLLRRPLSLSSSGWLTCLEVMKRFGVRAATTSPVRDDNILLGPRRRREEIETACSGEIGNWSRPANDLIAWRGDGRTLDRAWTWSLQDDHHFFLVTIFYRSRLGHSAQETSIIFSCISVSR